MQFVSLSNICVSPGSVIILLKYVENFYRVSVYNSVVTEDGRTYLFTSADDNNVDDDMMMMTMMCPHVSS